MTIPGAVPIAHRAVLLRVAPWGGGEIHGGQLRSAQISGLVCRALPDAEHLVAQHPRTLPRRALAGLAIKGVVEALITRRKLTEGLFTAWVDSLVDKLALGRGDLIIYDADPRYGAAVVNVAARRGLRVIALPHNIEALLPKAFPIVIDAVREGRALTAEMRWLARVEAVWTIGVFDQELLQLFGIAARRLPYVPPADRLADLLAVRARRTALPGAPLLILGTAHNVPTRAGMAEQLMILHNLADGTARPDVIVAGYGTEALADRDWPGVRLLGSRTWPEVLDLLANAAALWVHQAPMTGALTRIPEALMAGVPVLANRWAARGHDAMPGLHVYDHNADILRLLQTLPAISPMPDAVNAEDEFVAALRAAAGRISE